ncbi:MAG: carbohydrate ABC transporter permease, partial [Pseudonocardiaceae bacterium]
MSRSIRGNVGKAIAVAALLVFTLFPVYWMISSAFDKKASSGGQSLVPKEFTFDNFVYVLTKGGFDVFLRNSAIVAVAVVVLSAAVALLASVAVARFKFKFRTAILFMVLTVQMVPLEALVIPLFVQVRDLGLLNQLLGIVIVYVALSLPFGIWMLRGFVAAVPVELEEAAYLDGASWWRMFRSVMLPLVMPGLVATSVFSFITAWNEFIFAMTLL